MLSRGDDRKTAGAPWGDGGGVQLVEGEGKKIYFYCHKTPVLSVCICQNNSQ